MDGTEYGPRASSLFACMARGDQLFEKAKAFVENLDAISTKEIRQALGLDELEALRLMNQLEKAGIISAEWNVKLGGYKILKSGGGQ